MLKITLASRLRCILHGLVSTRTLYYLLPSLDYFASYLASYLCPLTSPVMIFAPGDSMLSCVPFATIRAITLVLTFKSRLPFRQRYYSLLRRLHVLLGRFISGNVETLLCRDYSSLGFDRFWSPRRTSTAAISCPFGPRHSQESECRNANIGTTSAVLANKISSCTLVHVTIHLFNNLWAIILRLITLLFDKIFDPSSRLDGNGNCNWCHSLSHVPFGITFHSQRSEHYSQCYAHNNGNCRLHLSLLHPAVQQSLWKYKTCQLSQRIFSNLEWKKNKLQELHCGLRSKSSLEPRANLKTAWLWRCICYSSLITMLRYSTSPFSKESSSVIPESTIDSLDFAKKRLVVGLWLNLVLFIVEVLNNLSLKSSAVLVAAWWNCAFSLPSLWLENRPWTRAWKWSYRNFMSKVLSVI